MCVKPQRIHFPAAQAVVVALCDGRNFDARNFTDDQQLGLVVGRDAKSRAWEHQHDIR